MRYEIIPIDRIASDRFECDTLLHRPLAINKLTPLNSPRPFQIRKVSPSSSTVRCQVYKEGRQSVSLHTMFRNLFRKRIVMVIVVASDLVFEYFQRFHISCVVKALKASCSRAYGLDDWLGGVGGCPVGVAYFFDDFAFVAIVGPDFGWFKGTFAVKR